MTDTVQHAVAVESEGWFEAELTHPVSGAFTVTVRTDADGPIRLEVFTASLGWLALPEPFGGAEFLLSSTEPLRQFRMLGAEAPITSGVITVDLAPPWHTLRPDWVVGPLTFPARWAPKEGLTEVAAPATWEVVNRLRCDGAVLTGERITLEQGGALHLIFDKPLSAGWYEIEARCQTPAGRPAMVHPRLWWNDSARVETVLHESAPGRYIGAVQLDQPASSAVFSPRDRAGVVEVPHLTIHGRSALSAKFGSLRRALATRVRRRRRVTGWAPARPALHAGTNDAQARVSIVTATRDAPEHLGRFLDSLRHTAYRNRELILVDNGTEDAAARARLASAEATVVRDERPFNFSALNNRGAALASGDILVFANNDVEFRDPAWLDHLVGALQLPGVGIAGALLTYPNGRIQHAGLVLAGEARVRHLERHRSLNGGGFAGRFNETTEVSAVTGALMCMRADTFRALGGFDARQFGTLYNDVDLCLRARKAEWSVVLCGKSRAVHHESVSLARGDDPIRGRGGAVWRLMRSREADGFRAKWSEWLDDDPCYPQAANALQACFSRC